MSKIKHGAKTFNARLERMPGRLGWTIARIPFDAAKLWGKRGQIKVKGEINAFPFRTSLFPTGAGNHYLLVNKKMQKGASVRPGMLASFHLEPDAAERVIGIPAEFERLLRQSKPLLRFYESLSHSQRNEAAKWITEPKNAETRLRRAEQLAERFLATMDAERELPPVLRIALSENPKAYDGWLRMTPTQRRHQLLGIFYYQNPESRAHRIQKAMEKMLERSEMK